MDQVWIIWWCLSSSCLDLAWWNLEQSLLLALQADETADTYLLKDCGNVFLFFSGGGGQGAGNCIICISFYPKNHYINPSVLCREDFFMFLFVKKPTDLRLEILSSTFHGVPIFQPYRDGEDRHPVTGRLTTPNFQPPRSPRSEGCFNPSAFRG